MIYNAEEYARLRNYVLSVSLVAWIVILVGQSEPRVPSCCLARNATPSVKGLLHLNSAASLATGWAVMLVAMMAPTLVAPINHIRISSFARQRPRAIALFTAAYGGVWMAVGGVMLAAELVVTDMFRRSFLPAILLGMVALVWQASPFKQRCLNRCHNHRPLSAFG